MASEPIGNGGPPAAGARRTWGTALAIFFGCLAVYHANGRNHSGVDTITVPYTAWSLLRHGSLDVHYYPELAKFHGAQLLELPDGRWFANRPLGAALAALPVLAPLAAFQERPPRMVNMNHLGKLIGAASTAAAAVVFFFLCRRLAPGGAWPATVLFAFGTCLWSTASQALWMHGPATLWLCCALWALLDLDERPGSVRPALAGLALGLAFLTRPTTALFGLAAVAVLVKGRRWASLAALIVGGAAPAGLYFLVNSAQYGNFVLGGYASEFHDSHTPLWLGVSGLLVAPSRGLFVYSPALLLLPVGVWALFRTGPARPDAWRRGLLLCWLAAAAVTVVGYGRWDCWYGGWCYGPRFLCEILPICCIFFALGYAALPHVWARRAALVLVALSVFVHLVGVFGDRAADGWFVRHDLNDQGRCLFSLRDTQIAAFTRGVGEAAVLRFSP